MLALLFSAAEECMT